MASSGKACYGETDIRSRVVVDFDAETHKDFSPVETLDCGETRPF